MADPTPAKPALPPHPMHRSSRRMFALGALYVVLGGAMATVFPGAAPLGAVFTALGVLFVTVGVRQRRVGAAVMLNNAAHDLLTQGRYDDALALLDAIPPARRTGLVGMAALSQRAYVLFAQGDAAGALAHSTRALALTIPLLARGQARQYQVALRAHRALMLAAAGESDAARAEADQVDAAPESLPMLKGIAALARAVTHARANDREALVAELARGRGALDQLTGREAMLARALGRLAAAPPGSAYRAAASRDGELSPDARWIVAVVPQAAAFAPRTAERGAQVDASLLPAPTDDARARVAASRALAVKLAPSAQLRAALVTVAVLGVAAGFGLFVGAPAMALAPWGLMAMAVGLVAWTMRRQRGAERALREARRLYADGREDDADAGLGRIRKGSLTAYAAVALLDLAEHAERRDDLPGALAHVDRALGMLLKSAAVKASTSDILIPSLVALRARVLAAMGTTDDALAELELLAREHPAFPFATGAALAVRVVVALRLGDRPLARALARTRATDTRLPRHVEALFELLVGEDGWYEADGERERIAAELSAHPGVRAWIERVAPGLATLPAPGTTGVRIADLGGTIDPELAEPAVAVKGESREG